MLGWQKRCQLSAAGSRLFARRPTLLRHTRRDLLVRNPQVNETALADPSPANISHVVGGVNPSSLWHGLLPTQTWVGFDTIKHCGLVCLLHEKCAPSTRHEACMLVLFSEVTIQSWPPEPVATIVLILSRLLGPPLAPGRCWLVWRLATLWPTEGLFGGGEASQSSHGGLSFEVRRTSTFFWRYWDTSLARSSASSGFQAGRSRRASLTASPQATSAMALMSRLQLEWAPNSSAC